jgi:Rad3-related DNA helicase
VRKVVLMSATVREKTAELLGIAEDEMTFVEYPSSFPVERRPIIFVPSVQMNYRTEQDDAQMMVWLARLDTILGARLDRKGVIHAVSYKRAQFIKDNSEHGRHMLIHNSRNRAEVVEQYKRTAAPCILVSPSVDTGYDFAGDLARFQIIAKLPFASTQDKVMKARQERDPNYGMFLASQVLVQMTGRSTRSEFDWSETFILDDNWRWAFRKMKEFLPDWWVQGLVWADGPTKPVVMDGNGVGIGDGGL